VAEGRLNTIDLPLGPKHQGKVRDWWDLGDRRLIVTTDRQSAFDVVVGTIPHKGQVLNQLAAWWFAETTDIVANHLLSVPDPNVSLVRTARVWPVEMVIRGYITGVTDTSLWPSYARGERDIYGLSFPDGLRKNDRLPQPVITPTTKAESGSHDERLTSGRILELGLVPEPVYRAMEAATYALFARGTGVCAERGLILVDTKYEFGDVDGELVVIDEVHTPDSSRFWLADTYTDRVERGEEPETFDKEFLRRWFVEQGYRGDGAAPPIPDELAERMSHLYIDAFERITGGPFAHAADGDPGARIRANLERAGIL
jgi:phosphoribosylaminoimidazole-succinocarboxamide synthase